MGAGRNWSGALSNASISGGQLWVEARLYNVDAKSHVLLELRNSFGLVANQMHELSSTGPELAAFDRWRRLVSVGGIRGTKANLLMNGLRVYTNSTTVEAHGGQPVFYSRREDGPYYRWSFDDGSRAWQVGRVVRWDISPKMLALATWKKIPAGLKRSMADHYQE
jgi:hypothetical protein